MVRIACGALIVLLGVVGAVPTGIEGSPDTAAGAEMPVVGACSEQEAVDDGSDQQSSAGITITMTTEEEDEDGPKASARVALRAVYSGTGA